jgi:hypothetical protein
LVKVRLKSLISRHIYSLPMIDRQLPSYSDLAGFAIEL